MNTEQFRWLDDNPENDTYEFCSVHIVDGRIDVSTKPNKSTIGVVDGTQLDIDSSWATVQISGRVLVYGWAYKPPQWILIGENVKIGPYGSVDEYFIRG